MPRILLFVSFYGVLLETLCALFHHHYYKMILFDFTEQIHLAGAHTATSQKKGQKPTKAPTSSAKLSMSPAGGGSSKKKTKSIRIPQPLHQPSPPTKSSLLSTTHEPITGSLLLDTSDIQLGEASNVFKLESASQPVQSNTEQSLDLMLSDSSKLSSSMMDIPLQNSTLPPDAIFSSDDNSSSNDFLSDSS